MPKIKVWWAELSKKQKVIFGILTSLIIISAISFSIYYFVKPKDNLSDDGNWEKLQIPDRPAPSFVLAPKVDKKFGISANETFVLVSKTPTTEDQVREILSASKPVKVSQKSETEFEITPVAKLSPDETIQLTVSHDNQKYNWAFQVAPKLKIVDSLPRNNALNVPVNAGIEITFNTDNYDNFVKEIEVLPKFDFRTEKHDQKLVIVPTNPLNFKSEYMVSIKSMEYSFSFQTADVDNNGRLTLNNNFQQVHPNEQLQTKVNASIDKNSSIKTEVFKFNNSVDFIDSRKKIDQITSSWKSYYGEMNKIDLTNLSKISEVNLSIQIQDQLNYLQLPFNLNEGFYFIQFTYSNGEKSEHLWVQSTPILGYVSVAREQSMIWINSLNNEPINESRVSVVGTTDTYTTNNEGWAAFPTQESLFDKSKHYIQIVTTTGKELILPISTLGDKTKPNQKTQSDYWSYLYNERILYKPTDTIYFWGVAKDKDTGNIPSSVVVGLGSYDKPVEFSETVVPNLDGSFIGRLDLKDFETGSYNLKAFVDNVEIASSYLSISDFIKPEFKIELTTDKKAIFSDEKAVFNGKIGFFDGTPASNIPLKIYQSFGGENKNLDANKKGEFSYDYLSKYDSNGSYPRYETITVSPQTATQGESEEYGTVLVYGSKLKIDSSSKQEGSVATVKAKVSNIDLDRINVQGLDDPMSGPAKNQKVNIVTEKTWYEQKEKGTYYDFVEKVTRKTYDYINHTEKVESKDLITDGNGEINYSINLEKDKSFSVILTVTDNAGHLNSTRQYFYYYDGYSNGNDNKKAELVIDKKENTFSVGEEVKLKITKNGELYKDSDTNKFLFVLANRGRQEVFVRDNPGLSFNFEDKYKPNIFIGSIIFNGKYYEEVTSNCYQDWMCGGYDYYNQYVFTPVEVIYQKNDSKLELSIQVDKTKYAPGDKASVSVLVTKDNNPVSNATVNLVLVDEALAAMGKVNKPFALDALYKHVNSFVYYNYYTHQPIKPDGPMAERGGGGGDRNIFKDTAFFNVASTNEAGVAEFKFDLPDNITNWLTYAQAVTSGVDAGIGDSSIVSTKEFFVTSQFPKVVTLMDNPYLSANSYGISLTNTNDSIDAEFVFSNDSSELSKNKFKLVPFKESYIAFPKLGAGNYKVTVSGKYQNIEDGITLPVSVIDSRLEFRMFEDLEKSKNIEYRKDKPLKLIVTDEGRSKYYYDLLNYCYISSNRIEKILAGLFARSILESNFDEKECGETSNLLSEFQSSDGGLRQVRWGNSDLESTFWAVYIDASKFNKEELTKYFESFSNSSWSKNIDKIMANWGLTILGKPQINNLIVLSKQATTFKEKVISALALNHIGQNEEAKNIYFDLLGVYGYTNKPYIRIQAGSSMDNYLMDTGYMLLLSSKLNTEYNEGMNLYLRDYRTEANGVILEVSNISFINSELTKLPKVDTEVSIKSKYQNKTFDLSKVGNLNINLKTDELDSLEVKTLKGKSESQVSYFATNDQFDKLKGDKRLKLKKTISKVRGDEDELRLGDILQVRLEYDFDNDAPKGCYDLTDHIPSGLTRIDNPNAYAIDSPIGGYMYDAGNNIVKGCAYHSDWWRKYSDNHSVYYVKVSAVGKYINEPAIMQSRLDPTIFQKTQNEFITIKE